MNHKQKASELLKGTMYLDFIPKTTEQEKQLFKDGMKLQKTIDVDVVMGLLEEIKKLKKSNSSLADEVVRLGGSITGGG